MYANRKNLAALFGVTTQTVYRRVKGIEALIGERYNQYAVLDNLVKEIEKWWDKKRVLWHVEQLRKIEEKYKE